MNDAAPLLYADARAIPDWNRHEDPEFSSVKAVRFGLDMSSMAARILSYT